MESVYAVYDGEKFVTENEISLKKGQKVILTILEEEIQPNEESLYTYATSIKGGSFDFLLNEDEQDYSIDDCRKKFR